MNRVVKYQFWHKHSQIRDWQILITERGFFWRATVRCHDSRLLDPLPSYSPSNSSSPPSTTQSSHLLHILTRDQSSPPHLATSGPCKAVAQPSWSIHITIQLVAGLPHSSHHALQNFIRQARHHPCRSRHRWLRSCLFARQVRPPGSSSRERL